jgi:hypothetical protein
MLGRAFILNLKKYYWMTQNKMVWSGSIRQQEERKELAQEITYDSLLK